MVHLALHGEHFFLVPGMHYSIAQAEFMDDRPLVDQHETHGLPGLDLKAARRVVHVAHHHLDGASRLARWRRLPEGVGMRG
ncbi:hypothetical protein D3C72_1916390 [compost metagenome]